MDNTCSIHDTINKTVPGGNALGSFKAELNIMTWYPEWHV